MDLLDALTVAGHVESPVALSEEVNLAAPAWYPQADTLEVTKRTPGQVQRMAFGYLVKIGSPARSPRPAGKGNYRVKGGTRLPGSASQSSKSQK